MIPSKEYMEKETTIAQAYLSDNDCEWLTAEYDETYNTMYIYVNMLPHEVSAPDARQYEGRELLELDCNKILIK